MRSAMARPRKRTKVCWVNRSIGTVALRATGLG
jgi:hypothetical protein